MGPDLAAIAREMKSAQDSARQVEPFTARIPGFDLAAAYEVGRLVHGERLAEGSRAVGRKIGFTSPAMWARFGVREPIWSYVYDATVVRLDSPRGTFSLGRLAEPRIEPEIVFGLRSAPRPGAELAEILQAIDWVAHGFEIVQSHFPGWKFRGPDTVADGGLHGALLVGPPQPLSCLGSDPVGALESFVLALSCDDRHVETGRGSNVLGSPLSAIAHLAALLAAHPEFPPLAAGEIVTTGTVTLAHPIQAGETWRTRIEGIALPGLTVELRA